MSTRKNESIEDRKARRAKALRANLKRRKAQARDRSAETVDHQKDTAEDSFDKNERK